MEAIPGRLREVFSERSEQVDAKHAELIERWSAENDGADPDPKVIAMLDRRAVTASRPGKVDGVDADTMHTEWAGQALAAGFNPEVLTASRLRAALPAPSTVSDEEVIVEALLRVQAESSTWLRADVARHLSNLVHPQPGTSATVVVAEVDRLAHLAMDRCVALGPERGGPLRADGRPVSEAVTDRQFTTPAVLDEEHGLQMWAQRSTVAPDPRLEPREAAVAAMASHTPLVVVVGPAGTGKTTTTGTAVRYLHTQRRPVVGLAPSGKAADVLGTEAGCATDTVAGFLTRHRHQPSQWPAGTTVILDEAAMAATADLSELVSLVRRHRWRLVAVGDPAQLSAVGRGGVFAYWADTIPHVQLTDPRRFRQRWEADASLLLRAGDPAAADTYAANGRLHTGHPAVLARDVARLHQRHVAAGQTVAVTTNTAQTARTINLAIQRGTPRPGPRLALADGTSVWVGDQIATRRNDPALVTDRGEKVRNRHTWTVTTINDNGALVVSHPERGSVELPARYVAAHVELGWAVTGYGNQGDTVDAGIAVLEPGTTRSHAYVALTRGRHTNHALIPDPTGLADPAQTLTDMIAQTPSRDSALATRTRLHHEAGIPEPSLQPATPADPEHAARVENIQRHLDALQTRPGSGGRSGCNRLSPKGGSAAMQHPQTNLLGHGGQHLGFDRPQVSGAPRR